MADRCRMQNADMDGSAFFWPGNSTGILLIHGFTATTVEVRPLAEYFRRAGFSVAGPLLPGHNTSPEDLNQRLWQEWAAAADQGYQMLQSTCKSVFVGGESLGGLLAFQLASLHPEASGVLAYSPALRVKNIRRARFARFFISIMAKRSNGKSTEPLPWQGYTAYPVKAAYQMYRFQQYVEPRLKRVAQPTLILQGEKDRTIDPNSSQIIFDAISSPRKELVWMKNSGHCIILDQEYELVMSRSLSFVQSILQSKG